MAKLKVNVPIDIESVDGGAAMAAEIGQLRSKVGRLEKSVAGYKSRLTKEKSQREGVSRIIKKLQSLSYDLKDISDDIEYL